MTIPLKDRLLSAQFVHFILSARNEPCPARRNGNHTGNCFLVLSPPELEYRRQRQRSPANRACDYAKNTAQPGINGKRQGQTDGTSNRGKRT